MNRQFFEVLNVPSYSNVTKGDVGELVRFEGDTCILFNPKWDGFLFGGMCEVFKSENVKEVDYTPVEWNRSTWYRGA